MSSGIEDVSKQLNSLEHLECNQRPQDQPYTLPKQMYNAGRKCNNRLVFVLPRCSFSFAKLVNFKPTHTHRTPNACDIFIPFSFIASLFCEIYDHTTHSYILRSICVSMTAALVVLEVPIISTPTVLAVPPLPTYSPCLLDSSVSGGALSLPQ